MLDSRAVQCLEFVEAAAIDKPGDNFAHIIALAAISGDDAIQLSGVVKRWFRRANLPGDRETPVEIGDDAAANGERMLVIDRVVIGDARDTAVYIRATKFIRTDLLAGSCLDKWRPPQENRARALHDDRLVTHDRNVRAAS